MSRRVLAYTRAFRAAVHPHLSLAIGARPGQYHLQCSVGASVELTDQERQIDRLVREGLTNAEIRCSLVYQSV